MMRTSLSLAALTLAGALVAGPARAAAPRTYQVTGPVVSLTEDTIVVQKGPDKWEIARSELDGSPHIVAEHSLHVARHLRRMPAIRS